MCSYLRDNTLAQAAGSHLRRHPGQLAGLLPRPRLSCPATCSPWSRRPSFKKHGEHPGVVALSMGSRQLCGSNLQGWTGAPQLPSASTVSSSIKREELIGNWPPSVVTIQNKKAPLKT